MRYFRTLKQVADYINARPHVFHLVAKIEQGFASTDRKIKGTRLRHPGKGRWGSRIKIYQDHVFEWKNTKDRCVICGHTPDEHPMYSGEHAMFDVASTPRPVLDHNNAETYRTTADVVEWLQRWNGGKLP